MYNSGMMTIFEKLANGAGFSGGGSITTDL
jgi:hypothetical protein